MSSSWQETYTYLSDRGACYGITAEDLLAKTPAVIQDNPDAVMSFWQQKNISHILPTSSNPDLASDFNNWLPENPAPNHARQDDAMSLSDQLHAQLDNFSDALWLI
jgi:hypothetical protein